MTALGVASGFALRRLPVAAAFLFLLLAAAEPACAQSLRGLLSERERFVVEECRLKGRTLRAVGVDLGVSESRASQLRAKAEESFASVFSRGLASRISSGPKEVQVGELSEKPARGLVSTREVAKKLGLTRNGFLDWARRRGIEPDQKVKGRRIPAFYWDVKRVQSLREEARRRPAPVPREGLVTTREAAKALQMNQGAFVSWVRRVGVEPDEKVKFRGPHPAYHWDVARLRKLREGRVAPPLPVKGPGHADEVEALRAGLEWVSSLEPGLAVRTLDHLRQWVLDRGRRV